MKKYILSVGTVLLGLTTLNAQTIDFGVKAGVNISDIREEIADTKMKTGLYVGGYMNYKFNDKMSLQPELLFSVQGANIDEEDEDFTFKYINIPLMFQYEIYDNLNVELGPQVGLLLKGDLDNGTEERDVKEHLSKVDFGMNVGATYQLNNGLNFSARYNLGLSNVYDGDFFEDEGKNSVISIGVGYKL